MGNSTLSIVTPSYNQADFIEECICSVKNQSYDDVEHIVVDGGSTDRTVEILKRYEEEYDLRWVSEPDDGQAHAVNKGIRMAEGDWIGWQNSDDLYLPGAFETFIQTKREYPGADLIYGDIVVINEHGEKLKRLFHTRPSKISHRYWSLFARNQGSFFNSDLLRKVGELDENLEYALDVDLFWRILQENAECVNIPNTVGAFRIQPEAKTYNRSLDSWEYEHDRIYDEAFFDQIFPRRVLELAGKTIKGLNLLRSRRWKALLRQM